MSAVPSRTEMGYVLRAARWHLIWLGALPGFAAAAYLHLRGGPMSMALLLGTVGIGVSAGFVLDDPAATTLASVPATLRRRSSLRAILGVVAGLSTWGYLTAAVWTPLDFEHAAVELLGVLALALACGALGGRISGATSAGICGASTVLALLVLDEFLLTRYVLFGGGAAPTTSGWWLVAIAVAVLAHWIATADPARGPADRGGRTRGS